MKRPVDIPSVNIDCFQIHISGERAWIAFGETVFTPGNDGPEFVWHTRVAFPKDMVLPLSAKLRETYQSASPLTLVKQ